MIIYGELANEKMIIHKESPFRKLPVNLERRQAIFLDGIRFSVEIAELAYRRLRLTLADISTDHDTKVDGVPIATVSVIQDAWTFLDSIFRLRALLHRMPRIRKKDLEYQQFIRKTKSVDDMRNVVQHLDSEIPRLEKLNISAWGCLSWAYLVDSKSFVVNSYVLIPGLMFEGGSYPIVNPMGKRFYDEIDQITLHSSDCSANISEIMREVEKYVVGISNSLSKQLKKTKRGPSDALMIATFQVGKRPDSIPSNR